MEEPRSNNQALLSRRESLLAALGRAEAFLEAYDAARDARQVQIRLDHIENVWARLEDVQTELESIEQDEQGKRMHEEVRTAFEERLFAIKADLTSKLPVLSNDARIPQPIGHNSALSGLKLPTISLPEFDGDYMQWLGFHDTFLALIHANPDVPEIQKFHYLKAAVKGEAAQLIETIAISAANYNLAWDTLVKRYANDYLLKKRHLQALFDIQRMKKETSSTLHALVDEFERHTKTLRQMGEPTGQWSSILEHLLCTRLHDDTLKAWEVHASTVENPDYPCLIDFLQRRVRVLESISVNHHAPPSIPSSYHGAKRQQQFRLTSCASTTKAMVKCPVCSQEHYISRCQKFLGLSVAQRQQLAMKKRLCHNCLKGEHIAKNCSSDFNCKHCNRRHHSLLHAGTSDGTQGATSDAPVPSTSAVVQAHQNHPTSSMGNPIQSAVAAIENVPDCEVSVPIQHPKENVFLLTALVRVVDAFGQGHLVRALLDSGSQPDIVSERMARQLRLKKTNVDVTIQGAGQLEQSVRESIVAQVKSRNGNFEAEIKFLVMNKVTANLPAHDISTDDWQIPEELALADPGFNKSQRIDMVLGAKHFQSFFPSAVRIHLGEHRPLLVKSVFGWVVTGSALTQPNQSPTPYSLSYSILNVSTVTLEESIERFWKTEDLSMKDNYSVEERYCESLFKSTTTRTAEGRYMVRLPRKPEFEAMMGESQINAYRRYEMLERRFERSPTLKEDYHKFLKEYLSLGHMRLVESDNEGNSTAYYLPHHPVLKESSTTTKLRVVFDGSAKTSTGHSLNEALCVGPVVQDDLITILLRFRTFLVALVADIAKMYRQVLVHPDDTHLQRILWRVSASTVIHVFELLTVTYGLAPSSFLATRVLQQLAIDEGDAFPLAGPALRKSFYVDDFIGGANSIEEAISLREQLEDLMQRGGFDLRKWTSSRFEVLQGLDKEHIGTQSTLCFTPNESIKALGIVWEPENDAFRFDSAIQLRDAPPTKRSILSDIAKLFDPLGLIAPVVVRAKILMQELWLLSSDWDEPVPDSIRIRWESICNEYPLISSFRAERYAFLPNSRVKLHTFADASESAYGACTYARCENDQGEVSVQLLMSKSRVSPLKRLTIPRLELCASVLAAHLYHRIRQAIDIPISAAFFWSDSAVTLQWLRSPPNVWKTFVANRVSEVQHFTHGCQWNHISGVENPADLVSRGLSVGEFLRSDLWKRGPSWLSEQSRSWPISRPPNVPEEALEAKQVVAIVHTTPEPNPLFVRWSTYRRLLHVTAYCLRFINNARIKARTQHIPTTEPSQEANTVEHLARAKSLLIRLAQRDAFRDEIKAIKDRNVLPKRSCIRRMNPFIDPEGILRVGGRLNLSQLPYQTKHPALLPANHPLSSLIAKYYHLNLLHGGGRLLLTAIREEFWPIRGRQLVRSTVRNCFRCVRLNPVPAQQQIGQLPTSRITPGRPFSVTGVDYAGPLYLRPIHKRAAPVKTYLCLFVCFVTKAVHLELVCDLSTQAFIAALRRFIARRGRPSHIHSDNGKNFEGAKGELTEMFEIFRKRNERETIVSTCAEEGIVWHFTPPKAPHFGGLWEAAVKVAKRHLFRQLGASRLSYEDMATVLCQIEAVMNSRPLLPMSDDPNDLAALTPAHFLIGTSMHALPDPDLLHITESRLEHYHKLQLHVQQFWIHWRKEYLQELQKDTKSAERNNSIQPGRMVVIVNEQLAPIRWPLARIVDLRPGTDQITRVVTLRTARGIITRPITKICLLPDVSAESGDGHRLPEEIDP
ncbi:uncharacterized protein LOC135712602 [Ochlerotatus camptorhynchus]|uniref:uncharacterized protein LOC135712602 n=1 Tax=Ochlerotatus camptorhynchus TaxID=644619 RepID=UPI0031DD4B78